MKPTLRIIAFLPYMLVSCSTYQKVSLSNFKKHKVSDDKREDLHYVLKKHRLHYSDTDRSYIVNNYKDYESEAYESHNVNIKDNIVIPTGTTGICIHSDDDHFIIDFGKGVRVPFIVYNDTNRPKVKIVVGERAYTLDASYRNARLHYNTRELDKSKPGPTTN